MFWVKNCEFLCMHLLQRRSCRAHANCFCLTYLKITSWPGQIRIYLLGSSLELFKRGSLTILGEILFLDVVCIQMVKIKHSGTPLDVQSFGAVAVQSKLQLMWCHDIHTHSKINHSSNIRIFTILTILTAHCICVRALGLLSHRKINSSDGQNVEAWRLHLYSGSQSWSFSTIPLHIIHFSLLHNWSDNSSVFNKVASV